MEHKVDCYEKDGQTVKKTMSMPAVFSAPIKPDVVSKIFSLVRLGLRQPHAVSPDAGMKYSAHSWGTGRAIARVPRISGSGTRAAGQGAFANFCRGGRLAHPTKTIRRWTRNVSNKDKLIANAMAIASTANVPLVESRGHKIENIKMLPIVVSDEITKIIKTKEAMEVIKAVGLEDEINRVKDSKRIRPGKGKMRNRRYVKRGGLIIIHNSTENLLGFRNIPGVETMNVNNIDIVKLAPGGHLGKLVLWTESAFESLDKIYGTYETPSAVHNMFILPNHMVVESDLEAMFYSPEVQAVLDEPVLLEKVGYGKDFINATGKKELLEKGNAELIKSSN